MMKLKIHLIVFILFSSQVTTAQSLKVITYNIHHGADKDERNTLQEIGEYIKNSNADLVGLQEVDSLCNRSGKVDQMKVLAEITGMHYVFLRHFEYDGGAYGLGILSKYPIVNQQNGTITSMKNGEKKSLALLSTRIRFPHNKEVVFSTVHFALDQSTRLIQAGETISFLESDLPVILTGDFNAEPGTEEIDMLTGPFKMSDENLENTFPVLNPVKKIDYIWVSREVLRKVSKINIPLGILSSDHLPLEAEIIIKSK